MQVAAEHPPDQRDVDQEACADYLKVGLPITVCTLAFGIWWLSR